VKDPRNKEKELLVGQLDFDTKPRLVLYSENLQFIQFLEAEHTGNII